MKRNLRFVLTAVVMAGLVAHHSCGIGLTLCRKQAPARELDSTVVLLHWNDFHSANTPYHSDISDTASPLIGGYATLAGYLDSMQAAYPQSITLNAGDDFQGSPVSSLTRGLSQILILNQILPDAFALGNHEFDYGHEELSARMEQARFPMICANIYDSSKAGLYAEPYVIIQSADVRVGIIGIVGEYLFGSVIRENVSGLRIQEPSEVVARYVDQLNEECDLLVVLSHAGFREDSLLATRIDEVDAIIGGHSHTTLRNPVLVNDILVCQAGSRGRYIGKLAAVVDIGAKSIRSYEYELLRTDVSRVQADSRVAALVDSLEQGIATEMNRKIAVLDTPWIRNSNAESNIGNWICDALRNRFGVDIAFYNSGGIRKSLAAGPVLVRDLWEIVPFDNTVTEVVLSGEQLLALLQWRIDHPRDFLQLSGLHYRYEHQQNQLLSATVDGKQILPEERYRFVTNNYVISHFRRFFGLEKSEVKIVEHPQIARTVLIETAESQGQISSSVGSRVLVENRSEDRSEENGY